MSRERHRLLPAEIALIGAALAACRSAPGQAVPAESSIEEAETDEPTPYEKERARLFAPVENPCGWDVGNWCCVICGAAERQTRQEQTIVERSPASFSEYDDAPAYLDPFRAWYARVIGAEHEHVWIALGCHSMLREDRTYLGVACVVGFPCAEWFARLPELRDRDLAREILGRVATARPASRWAMISSFERVIEEGPLARAARGEDVAEDELELFFLRWERLSAGSDRW